VIAKTEKKLIHIYAGAAGLTDQEYRGLLSDLTGKRSCADHEFSHADCDRVLASLEGVLFDRISRGVVRDPRGRSRWIREEWHFRSRYARQSAGVITPRQDHRIAQLWTQLSEFLPDPSTDYLARLIRRSIGRPVSIPALSFAQAASVLDALSDRLRYALRHANAASDSDPVPF